MFGRDEPSQLIDCPGFQPIAVSSAELNALFPTPETPDHALDGVDPELVDDMRTTYREIAKHNLFGRLNCKAWTTPLEAPSTP